MRVTDEIVAAAVRFAELEAVAAQGWLNGKFHNPAPSAETAVRAALRAVADWCKELAESKAANASVGMQTAYRHVERKLREIAGGGE